MMNKTMNKTALGLAAALTVAVASGCATSGASQSMGADDMDHGSMSAASTSAADLRVTLDRLLGEHVILATTATDAALGGRGDAFQAAAGSLGENSQDIADAVASVYGDEAGEAFLPLWETHIGFVVDYTQAKAAGDMAAQDKAVNDLLGYADNFGAFINSANPDLPKEAVAEMVRGHVVTLKTVIDAQAERDWPAAYAAQREAYAHMSGMAEALAGAIAEQFPEKFRS